MDRIELDEQLELEQYQNKAMKPLDLSLYAPESRFKVKPVSNLDHAKKTALSHEISQLWGIPLIRVRALFQKQGEEKKNRYEYDEIFNAFEQTKKTEDVYNPWGLFLWKLKNQK